MIGEIIAIGTEVVTGSTLDTNSKYLSEELLSLGIDVYYHSSVDDDKDRLKNVIKNATKRADLIITSGGLGPTKDDMTKEVVAEVLGLEMIRNEDIENKIKELFKSMNRPLTENNLKQAYIPKGAKVLDNPVGTAPGVYINNEDKIIIMLPGPPRELKSMFELNVKPILDRGAYTKINSINTIGIGESLLETKLIEMDIYSFCHYTNIATFPSEGMVEIKLISKGYDESSLDREIDIILEIIQKELKDFIYGYRNIRIEEVLVDILSKKNLKIGFAESCTGGLLASKITSVPGSSKVFDRSIISYSNRAKVEELGVKKDTLKKYGAVSRETAFEMAKGLMKKGELDIGVSITGIAGPDSDGTDKPVGLVYICVMDKNDYKIIKNNFHGNRESIQNKSCMKALEEVWRLVR